MKILLINDYKYGFGGAEVMFFETQKLLQENGHSVTLIGANKPGLSRLLDGWFDLKYYFLSKKVMDEFAPDIVHIHGCTRLISPAPLVAAKEHKIPTIMTLHDFEIISPKASMLSHNFKTFRKIKLYFQRSIISKNTDFFTCPSKLLTALVSKSFNTKNVVYLPNFSPLHDERLHKFKQINSDSFLYVGRLSKEKGVDIAIQAIDILANKYKLTKIKLYIVGEGPDKVRLQKLVHNIKLQKNIIFVGKLSSDQLPEYYRKCIAIIIPSVWRENSPIVAYEAMSVGIPIIATDTGGLPDLVENGKNGYLFEMGNSYELAKHMYKLYENKKLRINMGLAGYGKNEKTFSKDQHYKKLINLYEKLIKVNKI